MRRLPALWMAMTLAAIAGAGCYTVLRHPESLELTEVDLHDRACADCHVDSDLYHYVDEGWGGWYVLYPEPWRQYYQSPWWYEDYWQVPYYPQAPSVPVERGERHLWERRTAGGGGTLRYQGPKDEQGGDPAANPSANPGNNNPTPPPPATDDDDDDKDKGDKKRRLWGR